MTDKVSALIEAGMIFADAVDALAEAHEMGDALPAPDDIRNAAEVTEVDLARNADWWRGVVMREKKTRRYAMLLSAREEERG